MCVLFGIYDRLWLVLYDTQKDSWSESILLPEHRFEGFAAAVFEDLLYILGGKDRFRNSISSVLCYDLVRKQWSAWRVLALRACVVLLRYELR